MLTIKSRGVRIPKDISVMGYTDEPVASLVDPPLTTISQPIFEIGQTAATLLIKQIDGKLDRRDPKHLTLNTRLIVRNSTI
jgi:DNA-binding LacI/PurR family transcriptional regulator